MNIAEILAKYEITDLIFPPTEINLDSEMCSGFQHSYNFVHYYDESLYKNLATIFLSMDIPFILYGTNDDIHRVYFLFKDDEVKKSLYATYDEDDYSYDTELESNKNKIHLKKCNEIKLMLVI